MSVNFYWWHIIGLGVVSTHWASCEDEDYKTYRTMMTLNVYLLVLVIKFTFPISRWKPNPNYSP